MPGHSAQVQSVFAVLCTGRPTYVNQLDATTLEFSTRDEIFRTVGDVARTRTMLRHLMCAVQDHADFTPGVRVIERHASITYVDDVIYDERCANVFPR